MYKNNREHRAPREERNGHDGMDTLIYGKNSVAELLKSGRPVDTVWLADSMP